MFSVHSCVNVFPHVGFLNLSCNKKEKIITFCLVFGLFLFFFLFMLVFKSTRLKAIIPCIIPGEQASNFNTCISLPNFSKELCMYRRKFILPFSNGKICRQLSFQKQEFLNLLHKMDNT